MILILSQEFEPSTEIIEDECRYQCTYCNCIN